MSYIAKNGRLYTSGASEALTLLDDKFSVNKSYSKGDSCIYNDYLWKFTSDKPAGEWDNSVVEQCRIMDFVKDNIDVIGNYYHNEDSFPSSASHSFRRCATLTNIPAGKYIVFGYVECSKNLPTVEFVTHLRNGADILSKAMGYANSGGDLNLIGFVHHITSTNDLNIVVYDNFGNSATIRGFIRAVRLI